MTKQIKKLAVIGAGVMGAGLAALIANSNHEVVLLDMVDAGSSDRNALLKKALARISSVKPAALTHPSKLKFITTGNLEDDLDLLKSCDLVIEAIAEKIELKSALYNKIFPYLKRGALLCSNTSTLPLALLKKNIPTELQERFLITHFFNPPRYMELVEVVPRTDVILNSFQDLKLSLSHEILSQAQDDNHVNAVCNFISENLGKTIVRCNDTPGFIANRLGCFLLELTVRKAIHQKLSPVIIDEIFTNILKFPKTGVFGLYDLIGHDVMYLISSSLLKELPSGDAYHDIYTNAPLLDLMREQNCIGNKTGKGFYEQDNDTKTRRVISFAGDKEIKYEQATVDQRFDDLKPLLEGDGIYNLFFQEVLTEFYKYLFSLVPTVTDKIEDIDTAMKLGYNWQYGPYELLIDHIGRGWLEKRSIKIPAVISEQRNSRHVQLNSLGCRQDEFKDEAAERTLVREHSRGPQNSRVNTLMNDAVDFEQEAKIIFSNDSAILFSYHNALVFSIKTKMNILNEDVFTLLEQSVDYAENAAQDLIIYSKESNFSAGADLKFIKHKLDLKDFKAIDNFLELGQKVMQRLKYSKVNIISCARGAALGGGAEILLHSDFIVAHQELRAGLVETKIGLMPSFGGVKEMFARGYNKASLVRNIENILLYNRSSSADYFAQDYGIERYQIIMNKNFLLSEALKLKLPKKIPKAANQAFKIERVNLKNELTASAYNKTQNYLLAKFQEIIDLGSITENELLALERKCFLELCKTVEL
jgi:3-hydroxyacyl-CoA dehydrogenase / enoyl-CoA hydratase / 3-hydroxybutyryl-CoA epimerase